MLLSRLKQQLCMRMSSTSFLQSCSIMSRQIEQSCSVMLIQERSLKNQQAWVLPSEKWARLNQKQHQIYRSQSLQTQAAARALLIREITFGHSQRLDLSLIIRIRQMVMYSSSLRRSRRSSMRLQIYSARQQLLFIECRQTPIYMSISSTETGYLWPCRRVQQAASSSQLFEHRSSSFFMSRATPSQLKVYFCPEFCYFSRSFMRQMSPFLMRQLSWQGLLLMKHFSSRMMELWHWMGEFSRLVMILVVQPQNLRIVAGSRIASNFIRFLKISSVLSLYRVSACDFTWMLCLRADRWKELSLAVVDRSFLTNDSSVTTESSKKRTPLALIMEVLEANLQQEL